MKNWGKRDIEKAEFMLNEAEFRVKSQSIFIIFLGKLEFLQFSRS